MLTRISDGSGHSFFYNLIMEDDDVVFKIMFVGYVQDYKTDLI